MHQISRTFAAACLAMFVGSCSGSATPGGCSANEDCTSGQVCTDSECATLCGVQSDCPDGQFCSGSNLCTDGSDSTTDAPSISVIIGNDPGDVTVIRDGMVVHGSNLENAGFELVDETGTIVLAMAVRTQETGRAEVVFPEDIVSGAYALTATNQAGSDQADVVLLLPELSGELLIDRVNTATSGTLAAARLPVGTATGEVAAGDHAHNFDTEYYPRAEANGTFLTPSDGNASYLQLFGGTLSGNVTAPVFTVAAGPTLDASGLTSAGPIGVNVANGPPLDIAGNQAKVADLNADLLDGLDSGALRGGDTYVHWGVNTCGPGWSAVVTGSVVMSVERQNWGAANSVMCYNGTAFSDNSNASLGWSVGVTGSTQPGTPTQCAICAPDLSAPTVIGTCFEMWGSNTCPGGWDAMYSGKMASAVESTVWGRLGETVCHDSSTLGAASYNAGGTGLAYGFQLQENNPAAGRNCTVCCR